MKYDRIFSYSEAMAIVELKYKNRETKVMFNYIWNNVALLKWYSFAIVGKLNGRIVKEWQNILRNILI